jgi:ABC-type sugar transport system permease subunit
LARVTADASLDRTAHNGVPRRAPLRSRLLDGDRRFGLILAAPATIAVALLVGLPSLQTIWYSVQKVSFNGPSTFVGLDNYARVFASPNFQHSLLVTIEYALGFLVLSTVLGLLFALLLNEPLRVRAIGRTLLIIPWAAPWLMVGIMWKWFIDADVGFLNGFLYQFGLIDSYIPFLADTRLALLFTIIAAVWRQASLTGLLFLAALQTIPHELPEAAKVDGANAWQRFRYVTLPWLSPVLLVVLVTNTIFGFLQFDVLFIMTQGGPGNATDLLSIYLYRVLFNFSEIGAGSAVAVVLGLIAFGIGMIFVRFLYRSESFVSQPTGDAA